MIKKFLLPTVVMMALISCQFTETMTLNEDGSGRMSISMDMKELMAFGGMMEDTTMVKLDTIIRMKDVLLEKKDSIAALPKEEQERLKKIENFNFHSSMDPEAGTMMFDVFTNFTNIEEANEMMNAFETSGDYLMGMGKDTEVQTDSKSGGIMAVAYSYANGKFMRDAFIKDKERHQMQVDSMKSAEGFMSSMTYKIKYTFPKKIIKSSVEDARYSLDGKTIEFERSFLEYLKDPDVLDLEVELEQ
ncbi:MAG: hypothetical protein AAF466_05385 [Bacteroidota bacterium]